MQDEPAGEERFQHKMILKVVRRIARGAKRDHRSRLAPRERNFRGLPNWEPLSMCARDSHYLAQLCSDAREAFESSTATNQRGSR